MIIPDYVQEGCIKEHEVLLTLVEEVVTEYRLVPESSLEELKVYEPHPTGEFTLYCKECGAASHFPTLQHAPEWARDFYRQCYHLNDEKLEG